MIWLSGGFSRVGSVGLPFVKVYLDDVLVFSNGSYQDHLKKVEQVLRRLHSKNLESMLVSLFGQSRKWIT